MDLDKALADIENIRSQVAAGRQFRGFGPSIVAATGVLALLLAYAQVSRPAVFATSPNTFLAYWVGLAVVCVALIGVEMLARSKRHHGGLAGGMMTNAIESFLPVGLAGAAIWGAIAFYSPENVWMLPGLAVILLGIGVFVSRAYLPKAVTIVGAWFLLSGTAALIVSSQAETLLPWTMGLPLGIGQLLMAATLHFSGKTSND